MNIKSSQTAVRNIRLLFVNYIFHLKFEIVRFCLKQSCVLAPGLTAF